MKKGEQEEENIKKSENSEEDEDLTVITRKFRCFMKRRRQGTKRKPLAKGKSSKEKEKNSPSSVMSAKSQATSDRTVLSLRKVRRSSKRKRQ